MSEYVITIELNERFSGAAAFDQSGSMIAMEQYPYRQYFPKEGWAELDPGDLLYSPMRALQDVLEILKKMDSEPVVCGVELFCHQSTVLIWERRTGNPVYNVITRSCRRTEKDCEELRMDTEFAGYVQAVTGHPIDPLLSATKIRWLLDHLEGVREEAERGDLLCGTVDSWLIWHLSGNQHTHVSAFENCAGTMLFDVNAKKWDERICGTLEIPGSMLPKPVPDTSEFCCIDGKAFGFGLLEGVPLSGASKPHTDAMSGTRSQERAK